MLSQKSGIRDKRGHGITVEHKKEDSEGECLIFLFPLGNHNDGIRWKRGFSVYRYHTRGGREGRKRVFKEKKQLRSGWVWGKMERGNWKMIRDWRFELKNSLVSRSNREKEKEFGKSPVRGGLGKHLKWGHTTIPKIKKHRVHSGSMIAKLRARSLKGEEGKGVRILKSFKGKQRRSIGWFIMSIKLPWARHWRNRNAQKKRGVHLGTRSSEKGGNMRERGLREFACRLVSVHFNQC